MNWAGFSVLISVIVVAVAYPPWSLLLLVPLIFLISRG